MWWSQQASAGALELRPDLDQVEALNPEREALWTRLNAATFLTEDEKRAAAGYAAKGERPASAKFNPYHDDAGRFTTADGVGSGGDIGGEVQPDRDDTIVVAQADEVGRFQVNLAEEAARGGHTHTDHVGKSPELLIAHVRQESAKFIGLDVPANRIRAGSYPSIEAATKLTNATLAQNLDKVGRVASGELKRDFVVGVFSSAPGVEAYARNVREQPRIRVTTGVGISLVHDPRSKNGFTIISSYPRNDD